MPIYFSLLLPEISIVGVLTSLALIEIFLPSFSRHFTTRLNLLGLLVVGFVLAGISQRTGTTFQGMFVADSFAFFFKFLFLGTAACVVLMKRPEPFLKQGGESSFGAEFYLLLWSALLGNFFLVSSGDFLLLFVSLELLTLSLYLLLAYTRNELLSIEAGLKYLVLGSLASAFLLYGMSLIYASSGTLSFEEVGEFAQRESGGLPLPFLVGVLLVLSALGFKVAAVPFQVWVPDVYQGAPTPVVAFISVASKAGGFAILVRIFLQILPLLETERRLLFSLLAGLTLLYGNLGALVQKDMKRLLGFSSIGHAGFLLLALAAEPQLGGAGLLFYLVAYAVSNLACFLVVSRVENFGGSGLDTFSGLSRRSPLLASGIFLGLLSLAGVPPLAGFFSKFFILWAAAKSELFGMVFLGAVNVAISLYYYLNVVRVVYFEKARDNTPIPLSLPTKVLLLGLLVGIVWVGTWPAPFFHLAFQAAP